MTEFNLSEKKSIGRFAPTNERQFVYYKEEDVKEFIRLLKEEICWCKPLDEQYDKDCPCNFIDKLAGEKLI